LGDVLGFKVWVIVKDIAWGAAGSDQIDNGADSDTHAADARFSAHHGGIEGDSIKAHGFSVARLEESIKQAVTCNVEFLAFDRQGRNLSGPEIGQLNRKGCITKKYS
jgi:hypothetical protein